MYSALDCIYNPHPGRVGCVGGGPPHIEGYLVADIKGEIRGHLDCHVVVADLVTVGEAG